MRYGIAGMVLGASILRAATGAACQPPHYTHSVDDFGPTEGDVALNAPLLLSISAHANDEDLDQELTPFLELTAVGSDTKLVLQPTYLDGTPGVIAFVPQAPLAPNTSYQVNARLVAEPIKPGHNEGKSWELTTGTETRPFLSVEGDLKVTFEKGVDGLFDCESQLGSCGPECIEIGKQAVTKARISLPAVSGGFAEEYLRGSVMISSTASIGDDGTLKTVAVPDLKAGEPGELVVTMPLVDGKPYTPCFTFEVSDARRDSLRSLPVCLDETFPEPEPEPEPEPKPEPKPELKPEPGPQPEPDRTHPDLPVTDPSVDDNAADADSNTTKRSSSSCSTSGGNHGAGSALLLLLGLAVLTRRRQPKTAP